MGLFTPKWKSKNPGKRKQWVQNADFGYETNQILDLLINEEEDIEVRRAVAEKCNTAELIKKVAFKEPNGDIRKIAIKKIDAENSGFGEPPLHYIAECDTDINCRLTAISRIEDEDYLLREFVILRKKHDPEIVEAARLRVQSLKNMTNAIIEEEKASIEKELDKTICETSKLPGNIEQLASFLNKVMKQAFRWGKENDWPVFEEYPHRRKIRDIAKKLNEIGGYNSMQEAISRIKNKEQAEMLDRFFDGIGDWQC